MHDSPNSAMLDRFAAYLDNDLSASALQAPNIAGDEVSLSRQELADIVFDFAGGLAERKIGKGDVLLIAAPNCMEKWAFFWAAQCSGVCIGLIPFFESQQQLDDRAASVRHMVDQVGAKLVVTDRVIDGSCAGTGLPLISLSNFQGSGTTAKLDRHPNDAPAVIQFTSGSTSAPKGCALRGSGFVFNACQVARRLNMRAGDTIVSWLPTFHDMGLLSALVLPVVGEGKVVFRPSRRFLMRPLSWLQDLSVASRPHTPVPNFALALVTRFLRRRPPATLDLSGVCSIVCGAEPIAPDTVRDFFAETHVHGLEPSVFHAAYGMAEATLMVTSRPGGLAVSTDAGQSPTKTDESVGAHVQMSEVTCLGRPIDGVEIMIRCDDGHTARDMETGEIFLKSVCMMQGYLNADGTPIALDDDAWFATGDIGFFSNGELYVTGRCKDMVIVAGRNISPVAIEAVIARELDIEHFRVAAFGQPSELGTEALCVLIETKNVLPPRHLDPQVIACCMRELDIAPAEIFYAHAGAILKTTSGKIRRAAIAAGKRDGSIAIL